MTEDRASAVELYKRGLERLLALEIEQEALTPVIVSLAGCERLRHFFEDLPPLTRRQRHRLELLLRSTEHTDVPAKARNGLGDELLALRRSADPDERDTGLVDMVARVLGLQVEQYVATRDLAMLLGDFEAARHLQRSLHAAGAARLRLLRIAKRLRHLAFGAPAMAVGDFDRLPTHAIALP